MSTEPADDSTKLDRVAAAAYCGFPPAVLSRQVRRGYGPSCFKLTQRTVYFTKGELDRWLASRRITADQPRIQK